MSRWYQRGALGRRVRWVVSINVNQPGAREDVWQARPGGDGRPAARDAGGSGRLAVWFTGGCCAPVTVRARPVRVDRVGGPRRHARGDGGDLCGVFHLDSVDGAAPRVGGRPASGTYTAGAGSPASNACVGDGAVVEVASSPVPAAGWSSGCGSGAACVAGCWPIWCARCATGCWVHCRWGSPCRCRTVAGLEKSTRDRCWCAAPSASRARRRALTRGGSRSPVSACATRCSCQCRPWPCVPRAAGHTGRTRKANWAAAP